MDDKFRSRKWMLTILIQVSSIIGLFSGHLDGGNYATISSANIVAYSFANAAEYFANAKPSGA